MSKLLLMRSSLSGFGQGDLFRAALFIGAVSCGGADTRATPPDPPEAPSPEAPAAQPTAPDTVVAIGDLHADLDQALATLRMVDLVDESGAWSGGRTVLVQTGDVTDRGPDNLELIELLIRLEAEADAAGGQVIALLGNHELMNLFGDWRYVSPEDIADFGGKEQRRAAFGPGGALGRWVRSRDAAARVGDTVFVHGGISEALAARLGRDGISALNALTHEMMAGGSPGPALLAVDGPFFYRGYWQSPEEPACAELSRALASLGARRMVMGHTTQASGHVGQRCGGRMLAIDTGISRPYGSHLAAVRFEHGDAWAIYPTGRVDLPEPPLDPESGRSR